MIIKESQSLCLLVGKDLLFSFDRFGVDMIIFCSGFRRLHTMFDTGIFNAFGSRWSTPNIGK